MKIHIGYYLVFIGLYIVLAYSNYTQDKTIHRLRAQIDTAQSQTLSVLKLANEGTKREAYYRNSAEYALKILLTCQKGWQAEINGKYQEAQKYSSQYNKMCDSLRNIKQP